HSIEVQLHRRAVIDTRQMTPMVSGDGAQAERVTNTANPIAIDCKLSPSVWINIENVTALVGTALPLGKDFVETASRSTRIDPGLDGHGGRKSEIGSVGHLHVR